MLRLFGRKRSGSQALDVKTKSSSSSSSSTEDSSTVSQHVIDLKEAIESNNIGLVKKLASSNSAIVKTVDDVGQNFLHLAATIGNVECLEILTKYGEINATDSVGFTPLHSGASHYGIILLLLKKKTIDVNRLAFHRQSVLHLMAKKISPVDEYLWTLFRKRGIQVNVANIAGDTPLHLCCQSGHFALAELLLSTPGINVNYQNKKDQTPLHIAAENDHVNLVRLLLAAGGSPSLCDEDGKTPLEVSVSPDVEFAFREAMRSIRTSGNGKDSPVLRSLLQKQVSLTNVPRQHPSQASPPTPSKRSPRGTPSPEFMVLSSSAPGGASYLGRERAPSFTQATHRLIVMDEEMHGRSSNAEEEDEPLSTLEIEAMTARLENEMTEELEFLVDRDLILDALSKIIGSKSFQWHREFKVNKIEVLKWMAEFVGEDEKQGYLKHLKNNYSEIKIIKQLSSKKLSRKERSQKRLTMIDRKIKAYDWELNPDHITIGPIIGTGSFGAVHQGTYRPSGDLIAVKQLTDTMGEESATTTFMKEIAILSRLNHPNIVKFIGASISTHLALVMEYCAQGNLKSFLQAHPTSWKLKVRLARQVAEGVEYLHSQTPPIVHRDLKCQNILVSSTGEAKVSDFGLSKTMSRAATNGSKIGTLNWLAPEVLRGDSQLNGIAADVYAFGMVLYEILMDGRPPYDSWQPLQIVRAIDEGKHPAIPETCDARYKELMEDCWCSEPDDRPNFQTICARLKRMERISTTPSTASLSNQTSSSGGSSEVPSPAGSPHRASSFVLSISQKRTSSNDSLLGGKFSPPKRSGSAGPGFLFSEPSSSQ